MLHNPIFWLLVFFFIPLLLRVPIAVSLGFAAMMVVWIWNLGIDVVSYNFFAGIAKFPLTAIPFFILAGVIMEKAKIAEKIIRFIELVIGPITGGLAVVTVAVALFWGAVSGSGPATVAALGVLLIPAMVKNRYSLPFATGVVSVSSGLAIIIPPSIAFIVYGVITNASVGALFAAGIIPGIIVGVALMITVYIISRKRGYKGGKRGTLKEIWKAFLDSFWGLLTPLIILGGIYGGVFTPTEAAAVAVFYGLFVGVFIYRTISWSTLYKLLVESAISTSVVMIVVTFAGLFSWAGATIGLIDKASELIVSVSNNPYVILIMVNIILLIAGMLLDAISIFYVFLPIFMPIMAKYHFDPVWFGVLMTVNLAIGQVTPPIAVNLYVGSNISGVSLEELSKEVIPLVIAAIGALLIITYFPILSLYLPKIFGIY